VTVRHARRREWTVLMLAASIPICLAAFGAVAARPIADDFSNEGIQHSTGGMTQAVSWWMHNWTPLYSMFGALSSGVALERLIGMDVYYPLASLLVLALFVLAAYVVVRCWMTVTGVRLSVVLAVVLLTSAFLGSLASFVRPTEPDLFAALYWQSAWVPHLVPILTLPTVLAGTIRASRFGTWVRAAAAPLVALAGFVLAGFGFAEAALACVVTVATAWVVHQLRGAAAFRRTAPFLALLVASIAAGAVVVVSLPGASVRAHTEASQHFGILSYSGPVQALRVLASDLLHDAVHVLLTPALPIGLVIGYTLRYLVPGHSLADEREVKAVRVLGIASIASLVASFAVVALGDLSTYRAWWHLFTLELMVMLLASVGGWGIAGGVFRADSSRVKRTAPRRILFPLLAGTLLWCAASTAAAAHATWARRPILDRNVAAALAASSHATSRPVVWHSVSIGDPTKDISDMRVDPTAFVNHDVAQWFALAPTDFRVEVVPAPRATVGLP
jgi:hypothetical protein